MTEHSEHGATPGEGGAPQPIDWRRLVLHGPGHVARWGWLLFLYVVIVSYTFGVIGAWQFQDRIREASGDRIGANAIRQQLITYHRASKAEEILTRLLMGFDQDLGEIFKLKAESQDNDTLTINGWMQRSQRLREYHDDLKFLRNDGRSRAALDSYLHEVKDHLDRKNDDERALILLAEYLTADNLRSWVATPFFYLPGQENVPRQLATWSEGYLTLLLTLLMGALGSLLYVSRYYLDWALKGGSLMKAAPRPMSWFVIRPMFGMITALAILILIKAGQLSFSSGTSFSLEEGSVNPFLIAFAAIIAGLMSWQCLELIETTGERWLRSAQRRDLWASGLKNALRVRARTVRALADQIGRSQRQVERWMLLKDKVIPEMQDRIATWLEATRTELFGDELPHPLPERTALRASKSLREAAVDAAALARRLGESVEDCKAWLNGAKPMPPAAQDVVADWLDRPIAELFEEATSPPPTPPAPAKLDKILAEKEKTGQALSEHLGREVATVEKWLAGEEQVPPDLRARIAAWLGVKETDIDWG
jgi:transcriptional regulator with XRE-family HTH domain